MKKACSRCGRIHEYSYKCNIGRERKFAKTPESKLRSTSAWQTKRDSIKERAFNLCEVCRAEGIYNYTGISVHHIKKLRDDPDGLLDDNNLIALCDTHHKQADRGEIPTDFLLSLVEKRETQ